MTTAGHALVDAPDGPAWRLSAFGSCALTISYPGSGSAMLTLDPAAPPSPGSTEVALLVTEAACNSGQDADGRIEVVELRETASAVEVALAVTPRGGAHDCPSNPPTPFTIELDEPLGDRLLLDASTVPPCAALPRHDADGLTPSMPCGCAPPTAGGEGVLQPQPSTVWSRWRQFARGPGRRWSPSVHPSHPAPVPSSKGGRAASWTSRTARELSRGFFW
ncbi:hypothetical protein [Cellulomonas sp. P5_C5]